MKLNPIEPSKRLVYLDVLRGLAILFIYFANIYSFSGWLFIPDEIKNDAYSGAQVNSILKYLIAIFIDGKWYSIFSILFGIGFVIQYQNACRRNRDFVSFFFKRMMCLLIIGLFHLFFIWLGDILVLYAIIGMVLILFRDLSNKKLLFSAIFLLIMPIIHLVIMIAFNNIYPLTLFEMAESFFANNNIPIEKTNGQPDIYAFAKVWLDGKSWNQLFTINLGMPLLRYMEILLEGRIFKILACFIIGIIAGRMILQNDLLENKILLRKIFTYGLLFGIPMNVLLAYGKTQPQGLWTVINSVTYALGVVPLALAFAAAIAIFLISDKHFLRILIPVGKMALTNYLFQSIISIFIFYGIGLGFAFDFSLWQIILMVIIIFGIQITLSSLWLKHFHFGPVEWIWRMMTYQEYIKNWK